MKRYLLPVHTRRGHPVIHFIAQDPSGTGRGRNYWLGSHFDLRTKRGNAPYHGDASDYLSRACVRISFKLYCELQEEIRRNKEKYRAKRRTHL